MSEEIEQIKAKALPVLKKAGVLRSSIFGSVARGESTPNSDVDILVELPARASLFDLVRLERKLVKTLKKRLTW